MTLHRRPSQLNTITKKLLIRRPFVRFVPASVAPATILTYHRVVSELPPLGTFAPNRPILVHADAFSQQLQYLKKKHRCVALPTLIDELRSRSLVRGSIALTFDDGYLDNLRFALPLLEKFDVPATIFITTGLIDAAFVPWWYELEHILHIQNEIHLHVDGVPHSVITSSPPEKAQAFEKLHAIFKASTLAEQSALMKELRNACPTSCPRPEMLGWDDIRQLRDHPLITIGCHTHEHAVLSRETAANVKDDIRLAQQRLTTELKTAATILAYPFGGVEDADTREFEIARELGFHAAVTMRFHHLTSEYADNLFALPRMPVEDIETMTSFRWKLTGWSVWRRNRARMKYST